MPPRHRSSFAPQPKPADCIGGTTALPRRTLPLLIACLLLATAAQARAQNWSYTLHLAETVHSQPYTGRVYVFLSRAAAEPREGPGWFNTQPFFARDVENWRPGSDLTLTPGDTGVLTYPRNFSELNVAGARAQAVVRRNPLARRVGDGAGNSYSAPVTLPAAPKNVRFTIDRVVESPPIEDNDWAKLIEVRSQRLSEFHGRDVSLRGIVTLPASYYQQPQRRYPAIFTIPGFGQAFRITRGGPIVENNPAGVEFLRVDLDAACPLGHHVFADSANNGPVGEALVREFLPEFDRRFRSVAEPGARFLTGHSSGGWSSLWLQVRYPETFGGTWSTAPDPVDFRDFQQINIYREGENMYVTPDGQRRPLARSDGQPIIWYDDFARMEHVLGHGEQLHSFEAVFSPRGPDGRPLPLWDRDTGNIDPAVAHAWRNYDIRLILEQNWPTLGPKLQGQLHVFMGARDTFYLEGATILLKESLERLGSDAVVEIHPRRDHSNLLTPALRERIRTEMAKTFLSRFPEHAPVAQ